MKTTNYGLKSNFVTDFEENMEIIDTALKAVEDKVDAGGSGQGVAGLTDDELARIKARLEWEAAELGKEYWTGKYHMDGRKIYGKIIDFGALPNISTKSVPHKITNLHKGLKLYGVAHTSTLIPIFLPYVDTTISEQLSLVMDSINVGTWTTSNKSQYVSSYVTIEYTCTDR